MINEDIFNPDGSLTKAGKWDIPLSLKLDTGNTG